MKNLFLVLVTAFLLLSGTVTAQEVANNEKEETEKSNLIRVKETVPPPEHLKTGFDSILEKDLLAYLDFIASDALEGRDTGSPGHRIAAEYAASMFKIWGLKPAGDMPPSPDFRSMMMNPKQTRRHPERSFLQQVVLREITDSHSAVTVKWRGAVRSETRDYAQDVDYRFTSTDSMTMEAPVVFIGYGINEKSLKYNEYKNVDVRGKIVMMLTETPGVDDPDSPFNKEEIKEKYKPSRFSRGHMSSSPKTGLAKKMGALAILMVENTPDSRKDVARSLVNARAVNDEKPIIPGKRRIITLLQHSQLKKQFFPPPTLRISREMADEILDFSGHSVEGLKKKISSTYKPQSFQLEGLTFKLKCRAESKLINSQNVLGYVEGSDPKLRHEVVVIGAHLDHLGKRGDYIYNGADDNGSGSVTVMEAAQAFVLNPRKPKRSVLFALWTGEEKGLLGSRYYVDHPEFPIEKTIGLVNLDMVGRLWDKKRLKMMLGFMGGKISKEELEKIDIKKLATASFGGKNKVYREMLEKNNQYVGMSLYLRPSKGVYQGGGGSDHMPFAMKKVPWTYFMAGFTDDYHQPSDSIEKVSPEMIAMITKMTYLTAFEMADK